MMTSLNLQNCQIDFQLELPLDTLEQDYAPPQDDYLESKQPSPRYEITPWGHHISAYSQLGLRSQNLDRWDWKVCEEYELYAMVDAHGHVAVSNYLRDTLLSTIISNPHFNNNFAQAALQSFELLEKNLLEMQKNIETNMGAVVLVVLLRDGIVYTANLGDYEQYSIHMLNNEHSLQNRIQQQQVLKRGGVLLRRGKTMRLNGEINLSRSLGDAKHKPYLSAVPEISTFPFNNTHKHILIGSDGLWNELNYFNSWKAVLKDQEDNTAESVFRRLGVKARDNATILCINLF